MMPLHLTLAEISRAVMSQMKNEIMTQSVPGRTFAPLHCHQCSMPCQVAIRVTRPACSLAELVSIKVNTLTILTAPLNLHSLIFPFIHMGAEEAICHCSCDISQVKVGIRKLLAYLQIQQYRATLAFKFLASLFRCGICSGLEYCPALCLLKKPLCLPGGC